MIMQWIKAKLWYIIVIGWLLSLGLAVWQTHSITKGMIENKTLKNEIAVREERNEISNNRPDTDTFFDQLWNDPNW